jgi:hypothetical protein
LDPPPLRCTVSEPATIIVIAQLADATLQKSKWIMGLGHRAWGRCIIPRHSMAGLLRMAVAALVCSNQVKGEGLMQHSGGGE